ncbi:hypothetical protein HPB52_004917 [Rhipicephalus sanguineus]|uniref:Transmembrane protein n=1 Tax=Rhipicephalus sanguineus TaxID=34632 RepID=A0A9D4SRP3_RHISA|nr:hypothetical protein HPB52_004917 [Rhipicephalus sanguineus]
METTDGSLQAPPAAAETTAVTIVPADEPDMMSMTTTELWMACTGILMSSLGFFCVCLGLSYRFLVVTLIGYVMAPVGVVVFVAFLFLYQTSRRLKCQGEHGASSSSWKYDRVDSEQIDPRDVPMVAVRTANGVKTVVATTESVASLPAAEEVAGSGNPLRDSHV